MPENQNTAKRRAERALPNRKGKPQLLSDYELDWIIEYLFEAGKTELLIMISLLLI
jgi:hypothetical protein